MNSIGCVIAVLTSVCALMSGSAYAADLKYQQDLTLGNWISRKEVQEEVREFCEAAGENPNLKVVDIKYRQQPDGELTYYSAVITCHVSEPDKDLMRVRGKAFQKRHLSVDKGLE